MTSIEKHAFANNNLTSVDLSSLNNLTTLAGFNDNSLTSISFKGLNVLNTIGESAFANNEISSLDFTDICTTLTRIEKDAFANNNLTSVDLSGYTNLQFLSGFKNSGINSINVTNLSSVTEIGEDAFSYNTPGLQVFKFTDIPNLQIIGKNAFNTTRLISIRLENLTSLTDIYTGAFADIDTLSYIEFYNNSGLRIAPGTCPQLNGVISSGFPNITWNDNSGFVIPTINTYKFEVP